MKSYNIRTLLVVVFALVIGLTTSYSQKKATIHGELVELQSYVKDGTKPTSPSKKEVVMENIKKGGSLAIIEYATKKLYIIAPSEADTMFTKNVTPYLGMKSFVKGPVYSRNGVRLIILEDIGKSLK